ncbi:HNH endonuclease [Arthrobacter sp. ISL-69]|uniref:HNH endonuclease n=1 Tax=Arthrobacter sp. ISL-69 TaxID=2819113 RepID=UPI001BEA9D94|nr:HNH endonuclease [Arthrobacter sp. ISL-69]MBT2537218.1 HNH endonuclease [Arthrobacter sp. ISL-69]
MKVALKAMPLEFSGKDHSRFWAKVDKSEGCWDWTACTDRHGYGRFTIKHSAYVAHRVAYAMMAGPIPDSMEIDHACHNRACVRPDHLRLATRKQNAENPAGLVSKNKSGVHGVHWDPRTRKWKAQVSHHNQKIAIGYFATLTAAEAAVVAKRMALFTHNELDRRVAI